MRLGRTVRFLFAFLLLLPGAAAAQAPLPRYSLDDVLARGSDFERQQLWQQAAELYERALRLYPDRQDLRDRWKQAERRFSLSRRYHDPSFTGELLELRETTALDLYSEVLRKIQAYYVESIDLGRLVEGGYKNLDLALAEAVFLDRHFSQRQRDLARAIRSGLGSRPRGRIETVEDATVEVARAADLCRQLGFAAPVAVTLEFLSAAGEGLDPYSTHLSPNRLRDLYAMIDGNFVGLGVEVRGASEGLSVVDVLSGSPADEGGLAPGDLIVAVDGQSLAGLSAEDAANRLQGEAGSRVELRIADEKKGMRSVTLQRREVIVHSISEARILDAETGVGYARLSSFQKQTGRELEEAVRQLQAQGMRGLILDVRGNPGGLLDASLHVANRFIDDGVLVSTKGRSWGQSWTHRARPISVWTFPLVVLIDGESASASEIFAGAIKDHGRGTLVGARSFGKGSVQSIFPLRSANSGLRLTTAHFYSPKGNVYQGVGIEPDIKVARPRGPLGEERPLPRRADPSADPQLGEAVRDLHRQLAPPVTARRAS